MLNDNEIKFFNGTHRVIPPSKTLENYESKLKIAGITRMTDISDLDRVGIPVFSAIRPTAEEGSVSVYAGKGIGKNQAKASAMMEGFERYSAERQDSDKTIIASLDEISSYGEYINPFDLNLPTNIKKEDLDGLKLEWSLAHDLISDDDFYILTNAVFHPYIAPDGVKALFKGNTNGLASGNVLKEAVLHGALEVIERDSWSIFELTKKNSRQIDLNTIESEEINSILDKFRQNDISIKLMDLTADVKIPTIAASSDDRLLKDPGLLTLGVGCHLNPEIAVLRALTEVAQSRATQIHGAREDTVRADFMRKAGYERMKHINRHYFDDEEDKVDFAAIEDRSSTSLISDINTVKEELENCGLDKLLYCDLTRPEINVNVVRVIIPKMELYSIDNTRAGMRFLNI